MNRRRIRVARAAAVVAFVPLALMLAACSSGGPSQPAPSSGRSASSPTSPPSFRSSACTGADLTGSLSAGGGGAAGSSLPDVVVTNTSSTSCTMTGWPSVALVASKGGAPIGALSQRNTAVAHPTVTLAPHGTALIPLRIADALNYPASTCDPEPATGLAITPPGSTTALYLEQQGLTACKNMSVKLLTASAVLPAQ